MRIARRTAQRGPFAVIMTGLAAASPLGAQHLSARPASVSLTVVVPSRAPLDRGVAVEGHVALLATESNAVDLETLVSIAHHAVTRIEVRLAPSWNADSGRVWVRNGRGELEPLASGGPAVTLDGPNAGTGSTSPLRVRVESTRSMSRSPLMVPLEYRVKVGAGDAFSVWSFPSLLRIDPASVDRRAQDPGRV